MALELEIGRADDVIVVWCRGRIVFGEETTELSKKVRALLPESAQIVLNLGAVSYTDSGGLSTLIGLVVSARRAGGDIKLCNLSRSIHDVLRITKLLTAIEVYSGEQEAVSAFRRRKGTRE